MCFLVHFICCYSWFLPMLEYDKTKSYICVIVGTMVNSANIYSWIGKYFTVFLKVYIYYGLCSMTHIQIYCNHIIHVLCKSTEAIILNAISIHYIIIMLHYCCSIVLDSNRTPSTNFIGFDKNVVRPNELKCTDIIAYNIDLYNYNSFTLSI